MNEFSPVLQRAAEELRAGASGPALEPWALRLEAAAALTSGIALQKEAFTIARGLREAGVSLGEAAPSFQPVVDTLKERWERANRCCRR